MPDIYESISRTIIGLLIEEPFFAHLLGGIPREVSDRTETVGLELNSFGPRLLINEEYFLKTIRSEKQRSALIKHEALHVAFSHCCRRSDKHIKDVFDIAADLVVNQFVRESSLPEGSITLDSLAALKLKPNDTLENYYAALMAHYSPDMSRGDSGDGQADGQGDGQGGQGGDGQDEDGQGENGQDEDGQDEDGQDVDGQDGDGQDAGGQSGGGQDGDGQDGDGQSAGGQSGGGQSGGGQSGGGQSGGTKKKESASAAALRKAMQQRNGDHQHWGAADTATSYAVENLLIRARDRTPVKDWGTIPGTIADLIAMILTQRKPQVDWRRRLRLFGASSRRTRVVHTIKRVSKRYGTRPGIKIKRFQKILVALDTSGSIDIDALELFFSEVRGMWRNGADVTVIECDCAVQRVYPYRGKTPDEFGGGGGTDFNPVMQYVRDNRQLQFDGIVYLTDGYAEKPTVSPTCRLLWVITPDGTTEYLAFGANIQLT
ncbi:MAG: VWA-like domain-containing protein [Pseudomonadales bacterium]|nr:VWA-like domain-containing protein [Pseudomonadales bacterium]